jgi:GT2 family glycosyltransferase
LSKKIVIIPTYNERENAEEIIRAVFSLHQTFDVLIVDDNSPDGSKPGDAVRKPGEKVKPLPSGRVDND